MERNNNNICHYLTNKKAFKRLLVREKGINQYIVYHAKDGTVGLIND
ncbi:hypothetical protein [Oceanobacillus kimchii]|nr:hypothetical protein [Oceanobacillus kimchii]